MTAGDLWSRREVLAAGSATAAGSLLGCGSDAGRPGAVGDVQGRGTLRTSVSDLLGIEYPVLQAPMSRIVTPAMVAAVSNAGGLGIFPGIGVAPDDLRSAIGEIRRLTDRPFGVNLILHTELLRPVAPSAVSASTVSAVQGILNQVRRELGIEESRVEPVGFPDVIGPAVEVILDEGVPVFSVGLGSPSAELVARCHRQGMKVVAMASTLEDAVELSGGGVDVIAAQGSDAGGHRSTWVKRPSPEHAAIGTMSLVPQVVDAVAQPVIAAGGITNGRGLLAAIALGAAGALVGTRFIATTESAAPGFYKAALVEAGSDTTGLTDAFTGLYARVIRNRFSELYRDLRGPVLPPGMQQLAVSDIVSASAARGSGDYYPMYAGQGVGMIDDIPSAADVVRTIVSEARQELSALNGRLRI